jgi:hypothetical protein
MAQCKHRLVRVYWTDIEQEGGWSTHKRIKPEVLLSYGLFVDQDDHYLYLADTHLEGDQWGGLSKFPNGCVKKVEKIMEVLCRPHHSKKKKLKPQEST